MQYLNSKLIHSAVLSVLLCAQPLAAYAAPQAYILDTNHTNIVWRINHFGFSNPDGKFTQVQGQLILDEAAPANSKVNVTFSPANLITGIDRLDEHLKSKDFFDVAQYPTVTFVSDQVNVTSSNTARVSGMLTMHGVSKAVALEVRLNKIGMNMMGKKTAGFSATTTIRRSDFGMMTYLPNLGDEVAVTIESEALVQ